MNGSAAGLADQPGGQTTVTVPASDASLLSLATVRRSDHVGARRGGELVRVQVGDGGQPAQRRRPAVVQPVSRVQRLRDLGIRCQRGIFGVQQAWQVESRQRGADLVAVQRGEVVAALRLLQQIGRPQLRHRAQRRAHDDIGVAAAGFDQPDGHVAGVDALGAAVCQRVAGRFERAQLHRAGRFDLQQ